MRVGRPAMTALARGKSLRGTRADPFGRTEVRKVERRILNEFEAALRTVASELTFELMPAARHIASLPQTVRGYEQLKLQRAAAFTTELRSAITAFRRPPEHEAR